MENLPKDAIIKIALGLEMEYLLNYCLTHSRFNKLVCDNDNYWLLRLAQDHPEATNFYIYETPYKELYFYFDNNLDYDFTLSLDPDPGSQMPPLQKDTDIHISLSKYIPLADVKWILFETTKRFASKLTELGTNISWIIITSDYENSREGRVLNLTMFDVYNIDNVVVEVDLYTPVLHDKNVYNTLSLIDIYEEVLSEYKDSIKNTDKDFLVNRMRNN